MKHKHLYQALKHYGFSPVKSAEILLDAQRGDSYAKTVLKIAIKSRHAE